MLASCVAEQLGGTRRICDSPCLLHDQVGGSSRICAVLEECLQTSREHLLETNDQHTVRSTVGNHVAAHVQPRRARGAVVVDVVDGDARHAELVEDALAARAVAIAVACHALVYIIVVDVCVKQRFDACFEAQLRVVDFAAGLDELG